MKKNHKGMSILGGVMVFNGTFNNISGVLLRSVLLLKEIGVPGENHKKIIMPPPPFLVFFKRNKFNIILKKMNKC